MKCDRDCFHCIYGDCVNDEISEEEIIFLENLDKYISVRNEIDYHTGTIEKNEKRRLYCLENRGKINENQRRYYKKNREYEIERVKEYQKNNKERVKENQKKYRDNHKEKYREKHRKYVERRKAKDPDYRKEYFREYYRRKKAMLNGGGE